VATDIDDRFSVSQVKLASGFQKLSTSSLDRLHIDLVVLWTPHYPVQFSPNLRSAVMGRGMKAKKGSKGPAPKSAPKLNGKDASIKRIDTYEDTLEAGGVDDCESSLALPFRK
jgi:hypothetical protein